MRHYDKILILLLICLFTPLIACAATAAPRVSYIDVAQRHEYRKHLLFDSGQLLHGHVSTGLATTVKLQARR